MDGPKPKRRRHHPRRSAPVSHDPPSQPSVFTQEKTHGLFLWIVIDGKANVEKVVKVAAKLQDMVNEISDQTDLVAGVGFGPTFYKQTGGSAKHNFTYTSRTGTFGEMPSSDGDVFVHAKSDSSGNLFELAKKFMSSLPENSVKEFEDVYGFTYKDSRDLSGFIDGTENPHTIENRIKFAVERETGGSYVLTQKWIHDFTVIKKTPVKILENWVGRTLKDSIELEPKPETSHVARVRGGADVKSSQRPFQIVRQGMPFGTLKDGAGLFFISYASTPEAQDFMLDNMVGAGKKSYNDEIMIMSKNVKGTRWYFPGAEELNKMK